MDRRTFIMTAATGAAAGITPSAAEAMPASAAFVLDGGSPQRHYDTLYALLSSAPEADIEYDGPLAYRPPGRGRVTPSSDLPVTVCALLTANEWAEQVGITFRWEMMPDPSRCKQFEAQRTVRYGGKIHALNACVNPDTGERLCRCVASDSRRLLGISEGWNPGCYRNVPEWQPTRLRAESELSLRVMLAFSSCDGDYIEV